MSNERADLLAASADSASASSVLVCETVAFCETEPFRRAVLAKHWPGVPFYENVRTLTADQLAEERN
jgi:DNA (cytosine-5)-methyltransferase 1